MDKEKEIVKKILSSYDEIERIREEDEKIFFSINSMEFLFCYTDIDNKIDMPSIMVKNQKKYDYPHIMPFRFSSKDEGDYRIVCLYENNEIIHFMYTYEEKIVETVERLISLLSLSEKQIEREFQKEFLFYWNDVSKNKNDVMIYLSDDKEFGELNVYINFKDDFRIVQNGIKLNDIKSDDMGKKKWKHVPGLSAFYIPIIDNRGVLPPTRTNMWKKQDIVNIIYGNNINHISTETFQRLKKKKVKQKATIIIFGMNINSNNIFFAAKIAFKDVSSGTLFYKLKNDVCSVESIRSERVDYYYLCEQIGNETDILDKKVLLIGAGSLGSYVAKEIVKAGICNLTVYDADTVENENLLRHRVSGLWTGKSKVNALKWELEFLHPEVHVNAIDQYVDEDFLKEEMEINDLIIFTVGSSDVQLDANRVLKRGRYNGAVLYVWLEAGGTNSHILYTDYAKKGCFECLFTDRFGNVINNKVNVVCDELVEKNTIKNGCGATRVKYGTAILLRTTAVLLNVVQKVFAKEMEENCLFSISETTVANEGNSFWERKCNCCGNGNVETMCENETS